MLLRVPYSLELSRFFSAPGRGGAPVGGQAGVVVPLPDHVRESQQVTEDRLRGSFSINFRGSETISMSAL